MALTVCKECGNQVSTKADACPHCGAKQKRRISTLGCLGMVVIFFLVLGVIGALVSSNTSTPTIADRANAGASSESSGVASSHAPSSGYSQDGPQLQLISWSWHDESGYAIAEGQVKNISSENLRNVEAIVSYYTGDKKFVTADDAVIDFNPILPGQTSSFKTMGTYNPAMTNAAIDFKDLLGGTIPWKKSE
jgi:hypothetical protein